MRQSSAAAKIGLATTQIFGKYSDCDITEYIPALPGHRPAFQAGFVFLGFVLSLKRSAGLRRNVKF